LVQRLQGGREISRKWKVKLEGMRRRGSFETQYKAMEMTHVKHGLSSNYWIVYKYFM